MRKWLCGFVIVFCICVIIVVWLWGKGPTTTVIVIRHAERAEVPADDPPLTAAGIERAGRLAHVLEDAGVHVVFVTEAQRTQQTAASFAAQEGLTPVIIAANAIDVLVGQIRSDHRGHTILVVGHSNTVPDIVEELGGTTVPLISADEFDNLYIIHIRPFGTKTTRLKYGDAT